VRNPAKPVRVMIVEDSAVVRQLLVAIVGRDPRLCVAAAFGSAEEAIARIDDVRPDVISMDIRLPGMDGLEATRRIMTERPTPIVVIADSVHDAALRISMNALRAGALTVVEKPVGVASAGYEEIAGTICTQLAIMSEVPVIRRRPIGIRPPQPQSQAQPARPSAAAPAKRPSVIGIAASTGGPPALARVLGALSPDFPVPILLVQHMGAPFMEGFASWLDGLVPLKVAVARDGETALPGGVYVAPGDRHLEVRPGHVLRLTDDPPIGSQRPAATILFRSIARNAGARGLGIVLTGMGDDGASGLLEVRQAGGYTIAEDQSTCVVYGMPAAALRLGGVSASLPLETIGPRLRDIVSGAEP
jgi:two-component system, chemotaxis family, protein-glutamate methylesterase/glutaminase